MALSTRTMAHRTKRAMRPTAATTMRAALSLAAVALCASPLVEAATVSREVLPGAERFTPLRRPEQPQLQNLTEELLKLHRGPSLEEIEAEKKARKLRIRERNERARQKLKTYRPDPSVLKRMTQEEVDKLAQNDPPLMRGLGWGGGGGGSSTDWADFYADPTEEYDMWAQAYRMIGGYIDCDHTKDEGSGDHNSGDNNGDGDSGSGCSRWMIWAAYVDENYSGNGYYEYFGDSAVGRLDCHDPDTNWKLLGVYRQEFYQFIEQISKHLWAIDEYDYVVALAGLAYMTDSDCWSTGDSDNSGNTIYAGVAPQAEGKFEMALYTDGGYCLTPDDSLGKTFDSYGYTSNMQLESGDGDDGYNDDSYATMSGWWTDSQEYTLTLLNEVYEQFKYCTTCIDYPTYQDGYFIGDTGTDDDDLINQCWKFYSHDSFMCDADCIAKAHAQGSILSVNYNGNIFGSTPSGFYDSSYSTGGGGGSGESKMTRLMANVFVAFSFIVFVATFLAFAVARRSRQREKRSSKSRRLLDEDGKSRSSRSSRRRRTADGDGLFRTRSKEGRARSSSGKRSKSSSGKSRSKSSSKARRSSTQAEGYEPPKESRRSSSRSGGTSSRRALDDF